MMKVLSLLLLILLPFSALSALRGGRHLNYNVVISNNDYLVDPVQIRKGNMKGKKTTMNDSDRAMMGKKTKEEGMKLTKKTGHGGDDDDGGSYGDQAGYDYAASAGKKGDDDDNGYDDATGGGDYALAGDDDDGRSGKKGGDDDDSAGGDYASGDDDDDDGSGKKGDDDGYDRYGEDSDGEIRNKMRIQEYEEVKFSKKGKKQYEGERGKKEKQKGKGGKKCNFSGDDDDDDDGKGKREDDDDDNGKGKVTNKGKKTKKMNECEEEGDNYNPVPTSRGPTPSPTPFTGPTPSQPVSGPTPNPTLFPPISSPTARPTSSTPVSRPTPRPNPVPTPNQSPEPTPEPTPGVNPRPPTPAPTLAEMTPPPTPVTVGTPRPTSSIRAIIEQVALQGGAEFDNPDSYQSQSLQFLEDTLSPQTDQEYIRYYAIACIFTASSGVQNKFTLAEFGPGPLPGWLTTRNWLTDTDYCTWHGLLCNSSGQVEAINLFQNRMYGIFAPEVQLLADTVLKIDLFDNFYLTAEGDAGNAWIAKMTNMDFLYFGTTSFEYNGIPTFISSISGLLEIDFSNTFYSQGPIRGQAFEGLDLMEYIDIADNFYTTGVPDSITNLPRLEFLYLDNAVFPSQPLTLDFLVGMPMIFECWLDFTQISDGIPTALGTVSTLTSFSLSFCGLRGTIPTQLGNLVSMNRLWLYQNQLEGSIPTEIGNMGRLMFFYTEGNLLTGSMPQEVCNLRNTQVGGGLLAELGTDCDTGNPSLVACDCCTCCGALGCGDFDRQEGPKARAHAMANNEN